MAGARLPILVGSVVVLAILLPLRGLEATASSRAMRVFGDRRAAEPRAARAGRAAERLRFFVALGVYGVLGPWVARDFDARERLRRIAARFVWRMHAVWLPLFFVPGLFAIGLVCGGANALDRVVPHAAAPITIVLNPPNLVRAVVPGRDARLSR